MSSPAPMQHSASKALLSTGAVGLLVVSTNQELRRDVVTRLQSPRWLVIEAMSGADALERLDAGEASLVLLDPALPDLRVEEFKELVQLNYPAVEIVPINPHSGQPMVATPSPASVCFEIVRDLGRGGPLRSESLVPGTTVYGEVAENDLPGFVGKAPIVHRLCLTARLVSQRDTTVLITGRAARGRTFLPAPSITSACGGSSHLWSLIARQFPSRCSKPSFSASLRAHSRARCSRA